MDNNDVSPMNATEPAPNTVAQGDLIGGMDRLKLDTNFGRTAPITRFIDARLQSSPVSTVVINLQSEGNHHVPGQNHSFHPVTLDDESDEQRPTDPVARTLCALGGVTNSIEPPSPTEESDGNDDSTVDKGT